LEKISFLPLDDLAALVEVADVGARVGLEVGPFVGLELGEAVGLTGLEVGEPVGAEEGLFDGLEVGDGVGLDVGSMLGETVGIEDGPFVGLELVEDVGLEVKVGLLVGLELGEADGLEVGELVGPEVGLFVGLKVGEPVGLEVGQVEFRTELGPIVQASHVKSSEKRIRPSTTPFVLMSTDRNWIKCPTKVIFSITVIVPVILSVIGPPGPLSSAKEYQKTLDALAPFTSNILVVAHVVISPNIKKKNWAEGSFTASRVTIPQMDSPPPLFPIAPVVKF